jgi:hypothetical protein
VAEVRQRLRERLGEQLLGAWLLGSAALGDFDAGRSDLDVQAVSTERLAGGERERLAESLSHERLPCPARGLEFVLYAREDLAARAGPAFQLNLNSGARIERHLALDPAADPRFWFVIDASVARQRALRLAGSAAQAVFPPLPRARVLEALREALQWYEDRGDSPVETILSACRTWGWAVDGRWRSKAQGGDWALPRLNDPGPVEKSLRLREGSPAPVPSGVEVEAVLGPARAALSAAV